MCIHDIHTYSLFATMEYEETVAETRSQYVAIAVNLGLESPFRLEVSKNIRERSDMIWERKEYTRSWHRFLKRAVLASSRIFS